MFSKGSYSTVNVLDSISRIYRCVLAGISGEMALGKPSRDLERNIQF